MKNRVVRWLRDHTLAALTIAGLLLYGTARLSYSSFYESFGLEPEDVGIDYTTTLTRAAPGVLVTAVGAVIVATVSAALAAWLIGPSPRTWFGRIGREWVFLTVLAIILMLFVILLPTRTKEAAEYVKRGEEIIPPVGVLDREYWRNPLALRAPHVRVFWAGGKRPLGFGLLGGSTLTYLGREGDAIALYDVEQRRTVRVPASLVVLSKPDVEE